MRLGTAHEIVRSKSTICTQNGRGVGSGLIASGLVQVYNSLYVYVKITNNDIEYMLSDKPRSA